MSKIGRRQFLDRAAKYAVGGMTAAGLLNALSPKYAEAQQVAVDDPRLDAGYVEYASPQGAGTMRGLLARPADAEGPLPGIVVIHENRGLNPHIEDVARRAALAGFVALAPDALTPLGGYPGTDDEGRTLQRERDRDEMLEDFVAAVEWLQERPADGRHRGKCRDIPDHQVRKAVRLPGVRPPPRRYRAGYRCSDMSDQVRSGGRAQPGRRAGGSTGT